MCAVDMATPASYKEVLMIGIDSDEESNFGCSNTWGFEHANEVDDKDSWKQQRRSRH